MHDIEKNGNEAHVCVKLRQLVNGSYHVGWLVMLDRPHGAIEGQKLV